MTVIRSARYRLFGMFAWGVLTAGLLLPSPAFAQVDTGTVQGTVRDATGAVVPGGDRHADQCRTWASRSRPRRTTSGVISFPRSGLATTRWSPKRPASPRSTREGITLSIQQRYVADFTLKPSNIAETVNVTSDAVPLQTQEASLGGVVQSKAINELPLNGRNYTFLAQLNAGVVQAQQDTRGMGGNGSFSANGQNSFANNYLLDGVDNNSNLVDFVNGAGYVYRPSVDALQEFKVQTSSYSAELGRASGAVLNASLKSGGEQYRGNLFEFYRNSAMDAINFFDEYQGLKKGQVHPQSVRLHARWSAVVPSARKQADVLFHQLRGHHCPPGGHLDPARRRPRACSRATSPTCRT